MEKNSSIKFTFVAFIFLVFIVGGYILMQKSYSFSLDKKDNKVNFEEEKKLVDIRLDKTKDYVYFGESERANDEYDIEFKDIYINFVENTDIQNMLNSETESERKSLVYEENTVDDAYHNLVNAKYKKYVTYEYENYYSLIVHYYEFAKESLINYKSSKTYVFDKNTGNIYSTDELLDKYNLNIESIKNKVKTYIEDIDLLDENEKLDAALTVEALNTDNLFIDKLGKLAITVLVKSDQKDYNEDIVLS